MSNNIKVIYRILKILEWAMDYEELDTTRLAPGSLQVTKSKRDALLIELQEKGYIKGLQFRQYVDDPAPEIVSIASVKIALDGLQYLEENSMMKKAAALAKGIVEIIT